MDGDAARGNEGGPSDSREIISGAGGSAFHVGGYKFHKDLQIIAYRRLGVFSKPAGGYATKVDFSFIFEARHGLAGYVDHNPLVFDLRGKWRNIFRKNRLQPLRRHPEMVAAAAVQFPHVIFHTAFAATNVINPPHLAVIEADGER